VTGNPPPERRQNRRPHLFLSHRDVEPDRSVAKVICRALEHPGSAARVWIPVYRAVPDIRLGADVRKKIFPNIEASVGLVALWTSKTAEKPDWVLREIKYARRCGKLVALLVEPEVARPSGWPKYIEYYELEEFRSHSGWGWYARYAPDIQLAVIERLVDALRDFYVRGTYAMMRRSNPVARRTREIRKALRSRTENKRSGGDARRNVTAGSENP